MDDVNWKEEFFSIREIVAVIRNIEVPEDDESIQLEANLIVNGKRVERVAYSYLKQCTQKPCLTRLIMIDFNASTDINNDNKTPNRLSQLLIFRSGYPRFSCALSTPQAMGLDHVS